MVRKGFSGMSKRLFTLGVGIVLAATAGSAAAAQPAAPGWVALFNGRDIDNWMLNTPGGSRPTARVADGTIRLTGGIGYLARPRVFENFELRMELRLADPTTATRKAGFLFRAQKHDRRRWPEAYALALSKAPGARSARIAILHINRRNDIRILAGPRDVAWRPDRWTALDLRVENFRFTVRLDGREVLSAADESHSYDRGHIALQHLAESSVAEFRSIRLRELPSTSKPIPPGPRATDFPPVPPMKPLPGFTPIFDGKTLRGWRPIDSVHGTGSGWRVIKRALCGTQDLPNNGGLLGTERLYGDFELSLDVCPDFGIDSGIFLRGDDLGRGYQVLVDYNGGNVGGLYGEEIGAFYRPARDFKKLWKKNAWNNMRARIVGNPPHITTWLNGVKQVVFQDDRRRLPDRGHIVLQVHGGRRWPAGLYVRFANIQVKPLD